jgi:hypothetical protein
VFHLNHIPNYYTWTLLCAKWWNKLLLWILPPVSHRCSWCTALSQYRRNFSCSVTRWPLTKNKQFPVTSQCTVVLLSASLSGYTLPSASQTAANNYDIKCLRMNTHPAHKYTLHKRHEQWPSNQNDLESSVTRKAQSVSYMEVDLLLFPLLCHSMWLLLGCILTL